MVTVILVLIAILLTTFIINDHEILLKHTSLNFVIVPLEDIVKETVDEYVLVDMAAFLTYVCILTIWEHQVQLNS